MDAGLPDAAARQLRPVARYELRMLLLGVAVVLVGIPFGALLQQVTTDGPLTALDESAAQWLNQRVHGNDVAVAVLEVVSFLGKPIFLVFAVGLPGVWLLRRGASKLVLFLAVTCIGGGVVDTLVKLAVGRPRPELDDPITEAFNHSFPSGHAMGATFCFGSLLVVFAPLLSRRHRVAALVGVIVLCLAIGFSRLALGVHFISDVLGGYVLGLAWLAGAVAVFETWRVDRGRRPTNPITEGVEPEEAREAAAT